MAVKPADATRSVIRFISRFTPNTSCSTTTPGAPARSARAT
jgi:hypothetical protein